MAKVFHICVLATLCTLLYASAYKTPYYYDDYYHFVENERLLKAKNLDDLFHNGRQETRPIYNFSLFVQNKLFGTNRVAAHVSNIALHVVTALLLFLLLCKLTNDWAAFWASLLFAIHPLAVETVVYFNSRSGLLALFFSLFALYLFTFPKLRVWIGSIPAAILAMCSKEDAFAVVPVAFWFQAWKNESWGKPKNLAFAATVMTIPILYFVFTSPHTDTIGVSVQSPIRYFWHQGSLIPLHLSLFYWPWPLTLDRDLPRFLFHPVVLIFGWTILLAISYFAWKHKGTLFSLGWFWTLLALFPTHSFVPLADLEATRILYCAIPGMSLCCVGIFFTLENKFRYSRIAFALFVAFLVIRTSEQIRIWQDPVRLWQADTIAAPSRWRAWANLAIEYGERNCWEEASEAIVRAESLAPNHPYVLYNSAVIWARRTDGLSDKKLARAKLQEVLKQWPHHLRANILAKELGK